MKLKNRQIKTAPIIIILSLAAIISIAVASGIGPVSVPPLTTIKILISKIPLIGDMISTDWDMLSDEGVAAKDNWLNALEASSASVRTESAKFMPFVQQAIDYCESYGLVE